MDLHIGKTKNTFRVLQQHFRRQAKEQPGNFFKIFFNQATGLLLIVAASAAWGTWLVGESTHTQNLVIPLLFVQTAIVVIYFITDKLDDINIRIILIGYLLYYSYILFNTNILATGVWFMISFTVFSFAAVGTFEGFIWNSFLLFLIIFAVFVKTRNPVFIVEKGQIYLLLMSFMTTGALGYLIDYTARTDAKLVEEQAEHLEESNAKYDVILNSIGDGLLATDQHGIIEFVNKQGLLMLKMKRPDIVGQPLTGCIVEKDIEGHIIANKDRLITKVLQSGQAMLLNQTSKERRYIMRSDETTFPAAMMVTPVKIIDQVRGAIFLFRDISDEDLIDRAKSEFVSLASHQLRTPLNVVSWYVEKLLSQKKGKLNDKQKSYLDDIYTNNKRMISLVADLLNVSRVELGRVKLKKQQVDLISLIDSLTKEVGPIIEQKKLRLIKNIQPPHLVLLDSDQDLLTVIIQNLLSNAIKYTSDTGNVSLNLSLAKAGETMSKQRSITTDKDGFLLSVSDTGIGIPASQQEKIFSKLFRAENVQTMDVSGTGLGLYVTKSFVEALQGIIWFESEENKGTTFFVFIPITKQKSASPVVTEVPNTTVVEHE